MVDRADIENAFDAHIAQLGIVVSADTCLGEPRIAGTRIAVSTVALRFRQGESTRSIAAEYEIAPTQVENAIRFAMLSRRNVKKWLARQRARYVDKECPGP